MGSFLPSRRGLIAGLLGSTALGVVPTGLAQAQSPPRPETVQAFSRALEAYRSGDLENGDRAALVLDDPVARLTLRWAAIRLNGADNLGLARINAFLTDAPDWPGRSFTRRKAEAAFLAGDPSSGDILAFFAGQPPLTASARLRLSVALKQAGKIQEAEALIRPLWREEVLLPQQRSMILDQLSGALRPADHWVRIDMLLNAGERDAALKTAELIGLSPLKLVRARIAASNGQKDAQKLLADVPPQLKTSAGYRLALAQTLRDKPGEAAAALALNGEAADGPLGDQLANERRIVATRLIEAGNLELAFQLTANHEADSDARSADADIFAGFIALRLLKDPTRAAPLFERAFNAQVSAAQKARAAYWRGRTADALRQDSTGFYKRAAESGTHYYGQLAAVRLGQKVLRLRGAPDARTDDNAVIKAIMLLEAAEARDLALPLYIDMARQGADAQTLAGLVKIARTQGDARAELAVARIALQRGFGFEREAFPVLPVADRAFAGRPEDWALAHAIAKQESGFDAKAISSAGARGLMQILPGTAKETAKKIGRSYDGAALTADPGYNLLLGTAYFAELMRVFDGSMMLSIAAYNAGPGNVRKWIEMIGDPRVSGQDAVDWVERIPFSETRSYVQRVLENWQVYRQRQGRQAYLRSETELSR